MKILAIDTALGAGHAGLVIDGKATAQRCLTDQRRLAEHLVPAIDEVMAEGGTQYSDLDRVAVTVGPGSFTGLRIGLAAARAIGLALGCPVIGLTTLEVLAHGAADLVDPGQIVICALNARRGQIYCQAFKKSDTGFGPEDQARAVLPESILPPFAHCSGVIVGDGAGKLGREVSAFRLLETESTSNVDVAVLARLAQERMPGESSPAPLYLREPDAKLPTQR